MVDLTLLVSAHEQEDRLRQRLFQAERLEALGRLAGGVAHDMNNVLGVVSVNLSELRGRVPAEDQTCLDDAEEGVQRGGALIKQLLAFSRKQPKEPRRSDLWVVASGLEKMLRRLIPGGRTLTLEGAPGAWVPVGSSQLEQVVLNLVLNAADAAPEGSTVRVRIILEGQWVALHVEDEGPGIPAEQLDTVFEPFFTTKEAGGTGLGLPTVKLIVGEAGGTIALESRPGRTCVTLRLPQLATPATARQPEERSPSIAGTRVVLVDDNTALLRSLTRPLRRLGFELQTFSDPLEAREAMLAAEGPPDVLVTDVVTPHINGRQLADALRARWPGTPVVFISGYTADVLGAVVEDRRETLLAKPFNPDELAQLITGMLSR